MPMILSNTVQLLMTSINSYPTCILSLNKKQETRKDKIKVNDTGLGIATDLDILCSNYNVKASAPVATTTFKCVNVKGDLTRYKKLHGYQLNIKLALGAIASGI